MTELEEYERTVALLDMQGEKPTDEQISETISFVKERLEHKSINRTINAPVKEGYIQTLEVLEAKEADFNKVDVSKLKSVQGRTIVSLACDYLNGLCLRNTLLMVPLKDETWGKQKRELEGKLEKNLK